MGIDEIRALVKEDFEAVNALVIETSCSKIELINEIANYVILGGGKRLRCLLVLLASHACNYQGKEHIKLATMIEFFHTATLLHDDVIDDSFFRRGRKTVNKIWGNKASILMGDFLFTKYLGLMVEVGNIDIIELLIGIAPQMTSGEIQQFSNRCNPQFSEEEYFEVIRAKTALLFAASTTMAALISKADHEVQNAMYVYGLHLGNAFQLIDDALDYCSDVHSIGKNIGDDLANGKITLPLLHALKHGTKDQQIKIRESIEQGIVHNLSEILETLTQTQAIEYTRKIAAEEVNHAIEALQIIPDSVYKNALIEVAQYVVYRTN